MTDETDKPFDINDPKLITLNHERTMCRSTRSSTRSLPACASRFAGAPERGHGVPPRSLRAVRRQPRKKTDWKSLPQ